jgi:uncharacterized protein YebE (UPF0316 family)
MSFYLIIYFFAGVLQDFLFTLNLRYVAKNKVFLAVLTSFLVTVVNLVVLYNILTQLDSQRTLVAIIIYALGITTGTFFAMKFKMGLREK